MIGAQRSPRVDEHWVRSLPKAELHVHLEGSFSLVDLLELAKASGEPLPGPAATLFDVDTHTGFAVPEVTTGGGTGVGVAGLSGFLAFLDWQCGLVRTRDQAARTAYAFAARQSASGVRYSDVIVNPTHWSAWLGRVHELADALGAGFDEAEQDGLCTVGVSWSLLRSQSASEAEDVVRGLLARRPRRVVALSVDGDEKTTGRTGEKFHRAFTLAASGGLRRTVHAGESSGPEGVWDALDLLHAERIDHGVRAVEDPALLRRLVDDGVPLNTCPRSNVSLGIYPDWASHPLPALLDAGVTCTLNTDDPAPLGTSLESDWTTCSVEFGFDELELARFAERSIDASFADDDLKARLRTELRRVVSALPAGAPA